MTKRKFKIVQKGYDTPFRFRGKPMTFMTKAAANEILKQIERVYFDLKFEIKKIHIKPYVFIWGGNK